MGDGGGVRIRTRSLTMSSPPCAAARASCGRAAEGPRRRRRRAARPPPLASRSALGCLQTYGWDKTPESRRAPTANRAARPGRPPSPPPPPERALLALLSAGQSPAWAYQPSPRGPLHHVDARLKGALLALALVAAARASPWPGKAVSAASVVLLTVLCLPRDLWRAQLPPVLFVSALGGAALALFAEAPQFLASSRAVPAGLDGLPTAAAALFGGGGGGLPSPPYRFVLFKLGPLCATRRSVALGAGAASLTLVSLQGASLLLATSAAEELAAGLRWGLVSALTLATCGLLPLAHAGALGDAAKRVADGLHRRIQASALLLSLGLRCLGVCFEEVHHLCLGLAARRVPWTRLGFQGTIQAREERGEREDGAGRAGRPTDPGPRHRASQVFGSAMTRLLSVLERDADRMAEALACRGVRPGDPLPLWRPFPSDRRADVAALVVLAAVGGWSARAGLFA